jgi:hypothetical protein
MFLVRGDQQLSIGAEIIVERAARDAGSGDHVIDHRSIHAFFCENKQRRFHQCAPHTGAALRGHAGSMIFQHCSPRQSGSVRTDPTRIANLLK